MCRIVQHARCFLNKPFTLRTGYSDTLIGWSTKTFVPSLLTTKVHGTTGERYKLVKQYLPSLKDAGLRMYRDYDDDERAVLRPGTAFKLRTFGDLSTRVVVSLRASDGGGSSTSSSSSADIVVGGGAGHA